MLYILPPNVSRVNAPTKLKSSAVVFPEDIAEATYSSKLPEIPESYISILNIFCLFGKTFISPTIFTLLLKYIFVSNPLVNTLIFPFICGLPIDT